MHLQPSPACRLNPAALRSHLAMPALVIEVPGAKRSTQEPMLEKEDSLSLWSELATVIDWGLEAGDCVHASAGEGQCEGQRGGCGEPSWREPSAMAVRCAPHYIIYRLLAPPAPYLLPAEVTTGMPALISCCAASFKATLRGPPRLMLTTPRQPLRLTCCTTQFIPAG